MSTYAPQPGTTAYRAIAYLQMHKLGIEMLNSHLAEALGVAPQSLHACMARSLEARLVFARQKGGHLRSPTFWSLVDHTAASHAKPEALAQDGAGQSHADPAAHRITEGRDSQQVLKAEGDGPDATDRETPAMRSPVGGPTGAGQPAAAGPAEDARPAGAIPAGDGSQKPDDAAAIPGARAGRDTPQEGANRDASAGQSHVAGGSASPAGRGADGPTARGAAPVSTTEADPWAGYKQRCEHGVRWENRCFKCRPHPAPALADASIPGAVVADQEPIKEPDAAAYIEAIHRRHPADPAPERLPVKKGVRAALWSTGELAIETPDEVIVFDRAAADQVMALFRRGGA